MLRAHHPDCNGNSRLFLKNHLFEYNETPTVSVNARGPLRLIRPDKSSDSDNVSGAHDEIKENKAAKYPATSAAQHNDDTSSSTEHTENEDGTSGCGEHCKSCSAFPKASHAPENRHLHSCSSSSAVYGTLARVSDNSNDRYDLSCAQSFPQFFMYPRDYLESTCSDLDSERGSVCCALPTVNVTPICSMCNQLVTTAAYDASMIGHNSVAGRCSSLIDEYNQKYDFPFQHWFVPLSKKCNHGDTIDDSFEVNALSNSALHNKSAIFNDYDTSAVDTNALLPVLQNSPASLYIYQKALPRDRGKKSKSCWWCVSGS